jgi:hypothetical protein
MSNNLKLTALANEFKATMNHAEDIFNEYMEAAIKQAIEDAINELSEVDKMILLLGLMTGAVEDKIIFDLEELLSGEDAAKEDNEEESQDWDSDDFVKELIRLCDATMQGDNFVIHILG